MTSAQDFARRVNTPLAGVHHLWAERVLGIPAQKGKGIDLRNDDVGVEIKFSLDEKSRRYPLAWTVNEKQFKYSRDRTCYWGLGVYKLSVPFQSIGRTTNTALEGLVTHRALYILPWAFVENNCEPHLTKGWTKISGKWRRILYYPKIEQIPWMEFHIPVEKGYVCVGKGVDLDAFPNLRGTICGNAYS